MSLQVLSVYLMPVSVAILAVAVLLMRMSDKKAQAHRIAQLEALVDSLRGELKGLTRASAGMGRKVQELEQQQALMSAAMDNARKNDPFNVSYSEAARLVNLGASIEDIMNTCGISRPEAELVIAMTQQANDDVPILQPQ